MTDIDRREIDCFEKLADTMDFLKLPADSQDSSDTHWNRCEWDWIKQEARRLDAEAISAEDAGRTQAHDASQAPSDATDEK